MVISHKWPGIVFDLYLVQSTGSLITESQNSWGWKGTVEVPDQAGTHLEQIAQAHVQVALKAI